MTNTPDIRYPEASPDVGESCVLEKTMKVVPHPAPLFFWTIRIKIPKLSNLKEKDKIGYAKKTISEWTEKEKQVYNKTYRNESKRRKFS